MNFFDLLLPKRRKQKEVDLFFLHSLATHSGEYKDVLAAAFEKIKKLSHTNSLGGGKELMISYESDVPAMDCKNDDSPYCSMKTNYGWVDFSELNGKIAFVHYETPPHKIDVKNCVIEEVVFFPELFNAVRKEMVEAQAKVLPPEWKNVKADLPPLKEFFLNAYLKAYRATLPEILQELYRCCNGASSSKYRIFGLHEWSHWETEDKNFLIVGEIELPDTLIAILLGDDGKFYTGNDDGETDDDALEMSLPEFLGSF